MSITEQKSSLLLKSYQQIRAFSDQLTAPLEPEDFVVQSIPDVSPPKWHLAHTTWFFETFILIPYHPKYNRFNETFDYLFNSYYETHGKPYPRHARGLLSRPSVKEIIQYRQHVDESMLNFLENCNENKLEEIAPILEIGLHHEQQHQELLITDIKYNFSINPLKPLYHVKRNESGSSLPDMEWITFQEGIVETGYSDEGFSFDNERPSHKSWLDAYAIANRPVTNGEYLDFIEDCGYQEPAFWLSEGWAKLKDDHWESPLYWENIDGNWYTFTLSGMKEVELDAPVTHISFYEADAFARWSGNRLPTETEWEHAMKNIEISGNFADNEMFHPNSDYHSDNKMYKVFGDVWEWTSSPYTLYPGSKPLEGTLGEYNAKFMCNQMVLRGGSCATHSTHVRHSYRNFFHPDKRWQYSGIRLARDE
ncbi:ergothioneine biosynthesis protein EgtB [Alkalihalobacillus sp. TS-13]|uniref:ergothioneine biosynthesis protein EgtB n=1 Tax=Alkalihalobacillus sp. TS-13 TaxID=2842455 RepID=UPI0021AA2EEE|nr:ergothioneine biosynthesis protein EgtB [Alkalihalobacillus sp. TS-13]